MHRRQFLSYGALIPAAGVVVACGAPNNQASKDKDPNYGTSKKPVAGDASGAAQPPPGTGNAPPPATVEPPVTQAPAVEKEVVFTKSKPGKWAGKEATHAPTSYFAEGKVIVSTPHVMEAAHSISSHQIRTTEGLLLSEKLLKVGVDANNPSSSHVIDHTAFPLFDIYSRCNQHGLWRTTGSIMDLEDTMTKDRLVYTTEKPGKWAGKEGTHMPKVTVSGELLLVETPHAMTAEHYITKHQIRSDKGALLGENKFDPTKTTTNPISEFSLKLVEKGATAYIYSFCNLHGVWKADYKAA